MRTDGSGGGDVSATPDFRVGGQTVSFQSSRLWPVISSMDGHEAAPSSDSSPPTSWDPSSNLLERHPCDGPEQSRSVAGNSHSPTPPLWPRVYRQPEEVATASISSTGAPWIRGGLGEDGPEGVAGTRPQDHPVLQGIADASPAVSEGAGECCWPDSVMLARLNVGSSSLPTPRAPEERSASTAPILGVTGELQCGLPRGKKVTKKCSTVWEAHWWIDHLAEWNGRAIQVPTPELIVCSDAASHGGGGDWGAVCGQPQAGGRWSAAERRLHINTLELLAGSLAVQTFARSCCDSHVLIQMDNRVAVREQDGRSPQCSSVSACAGSLDMVPGSQHHSLCRVPAGEPER